MRSLSSLYAKVVLRVLIFDEEQFSYNQVTQPPRKIEQWQFCFLFTRKKYILVSGDDPICFFRVFLEICMAAPKDATSHHLSYFIGFSKRPLFNMLSLLGCLVVCLFVFSLESAHT